jgi:hypothetical protein
MLATPILEDAFLEDSNPLERSWLFLTVLMEVMYQYRFLYLNQSDLMQRYPEIDRGMTRPAVTETSDHQATCGGAACIRGYQRSPAAARACCRQHGDDADVLVEL